VGMLAPPFSLDNRRPIDLLSSAAGVEAVETPSPGWSRGLRLTPFGRRPRSGALVFWRHGSTAACTHLHSGVKARTCAGGAWNSRGVRPLYPHLEPLHRDP